MQAQPGARSELRDGEPLIEDVHVAKRTKAWSPFQGQNRWGL
jgi:hypothetical protein